jgi:uncharacterized protein (TIGR04206 family)
MAWVKSEYAGELAVLSTWLVGLAPWAVSVFGQGGLTVVALRFLPFRLLYILGAQLPNEQPLLPAWAVADFQGSAELTVAGHLGFAALGIYAVPFVLSLYYYFEEERITAAVPVDPVRLFGGLLGLVGVMTMVASLLFVSYFPGTTLPVGSLFALVFAYVLLTVDRT